MAHEERGANSAPDPINYRDADVRLISIIADSYANSSLSRFILTGSYAIEALTKGPVSHNDIDANIFTTDVARSMEETAGLLSSNPAIILNLERQREGRLEYAYSPHADTRRQVEFQFVPVRRIPQTDESYVEFELQEGHAEVVPTVLATLGDTSGAESTFRVKSLPYAIATWALRISGAAEAQKRMVRGSDIGHFALLLAAAHERNDVLHAMRRHPQMPAGRAVEQILEEAMEISRRFVAAGAHSE